MSAPSIFVSYSHADSKALAALRIQLAPLEREGLVKCWADTGIDFGANWDEEIAAALRSCTHVVPVLSANFFASDYISKHEIPVMLERQAAGELKIVPVFWSPFSEPELEQILPSGETKRRKLSEWQGLATPKKPMMALERVRREALIVQWIGSLRREVGANLPKPARFSFSAKPDRRDESRMPLSIEIERQGGDLHLRYRQLGQKPFKTRVVAASTWEPAFQEMHKTLENFRHARLAAWAADPKSAGKELLRFLFGDDETWQGILEQLFDHRGATFTLRKVDLRIVARERELAALPWRLLAFGERFLIDNGWTIATARSVDPSTAVQTLPHGEILIAAAGEDGGLADRLALLLRETWDIPEDDGRLQLCRTAKGLRAALGFMAPHLVVATGDAEGGGLRFGDGRVPCRELEEAAENKMLILSCRGLSGYEPEAQSPLLMWPRSDELGPDWGDQLLTFLQNWLIDGMDPVRAFHQIPEGVDRATFRVVADYREWQVHRGVRAALNVRDLLDRIDQKSRVLRECLQLASPGSPRKVLALIAHAGPDDGVAHHSQQLVHMLEVDASHLAIARFQLEIPAVRQDLRRDLEDLLRQLVEKPGSNKMNTKQALRSLAPRKTGNPFPLLFIDCGCVAGSEFSREELIRWIAFADECLLPNCPEQLRLVLYLGLHFSAESLEEAGESLKELEASTHLQLGTTLVVLPRLHEVPVKELSDFLREHGCPEPLRAAKLIHADTNGSFDASVALVEKGQKGWLTLIADLEKQHPLNKTKRGGW